MKITNNQKYIIIVFLLLLLMWFIWENVVAFQANKNIRLAEFYYEDKNFDKSFKYINEAYNDDTFINNYAGLKYVDVISHYFKYGNPSPEEIQEKTQKAIDILRKNITIRKNYARSWFLLGSYLNISLQTKNNSSEEFKQLADEANNSLEKAHSLSPKRQDILIEWAKNDLLCQEFEKAKEKSQECFDINPEFGECYWTMALSNIYLNQLEEAEKNLETANKKHFSYNDEASLLFLSKAYYYNENYEKMVEVYRKLVFLKPDNVSYNINLAILYKEIKEYQKAKNQALRAIILDPNIKPQAEEFIKSLPF